MKIDVNPYRIAEGEPADLAKRPTKVEPLFDSKEGYAASLAKHVEKLGKLQEHLYRSGRYALLIVLQGMDTAGKDGAIAHVMSGVNPQGCKVVAFKTPSATEAAHDFLWRESRELPERGIIGVFNRSYYEPVLVTRVHPALLRAEGVLEADGGHKKLWAERLHSIRAFERHLHANGTRFVKIYLHLSKDEQLRRLLQRLDDPDKTWKASHADAEERGYWRDYMRAYEHALTKTSVAAAPWHVVPADDKQNARLIVSQIVIDALDALALTPPPIDAARRRELKAIRAKLTQ
jgi:PPK2 family polyphosphate:nucleotide phosphotransferase